MQKLATGNFHSGSPVVRPSRVSQARAASREQNRPPVPGVSPSNLRFAWLSPFCPSARRLYRQIKSLGHECIVVAPSLIPKKPGERVKTNRRDALSLAKLLRAGELTAVWVPDRHHEAMRDLTRARDTAVDDLRSKRQQISAFLLRKGLHYCAGKKTWSQAHLNWLMSQKFEYPEHRLVFEEMMMAMRQAQERLERLEQAIRAAGPDWALADFVTALIAMRGIDLISAATFLAEIGDLSRFQSPCELMAYLGLVPSEDSTGDCVKRGPITKAGNRRARRMLVECAWSYQHPPRVGKDKQECALASLLGIGLSPVMCCCECGL